MTLCPRCRGGEVERCTKCGGNGWLSGTGSGRNAIRKATSKAKAPPLRHPADRKPSTRRKRRKALSLSDLTVGSEHLARRQRLREEDEAAWQLRQKKRQEALQVLHKQELDVKRERRRDAEERRRRRRLQDADRVQQEVLQRNLRPAGSQGTIVGPCKDSPKPTAKKKKQKQKKKPKPPERP